MKMKKLLSILLACAMILAMMAACGNGSENNTQNPGASNPSSNSDDPSTVSETPDRTEPYRLGMLNFSMYGTSMMAASNAIKDMCDSAGVELVTAELSFGGGDVVLTGVENLINMGVDGIMMTPGTEGSIRLLADLCEENGVDWFMANRQITDPELKEYVYGLSKFVGNDYCAEGDIAYEVVERLHNEYGIKNMAVIGLTQGDVNGDIRDAAIARACEDLGINLLTETRGISATDDVTNAVEGIISSYPEMDSIFIVGGLVTNGALAGANQALTNHNLQDKVVIGMIDIAVGMEEYMGEGKPLKVVAGGNTVLDQVLAVASLINHSNGVNADKTPYVFYTKMLFVTTPEESVDFNTYYETPDAPLMTGNQWFDTLLGKDLDTMQSFLDNFTVEYAKSLHQ